MTTAGHLYIVLATGSAVLQDLPPITLKMLYHVPTRHLTSSAVLSSKGGVGGLSDGFTSGSNNRIRVRLLLCLSTRRPRAKKCTHGPLLKWLYLVQWYSQPTKSQNSSWPPFSCLAWRPTSRHFAVPLPQPAPPARIISTDLRPVERSPTRGLLRTAPLRNKV